MTKHRLDLTLIEEETFSIIGIVSSMEVYRLAFFLNKQLNWFLEKESFEIDGGYLVYSYYEESRDLKINLIGNTAWKKTEATEGLFVDVASKTYLLKEKKKADYLLKICEEIDRTSIERIIKKFKSIAGIQTCYPIALDELKTTEFLIF
ncbi:IPExxxVDY family protein [Flavobacteriaceae bacterium]|nr:IPExxxVDY family protein [Flavobacteriaceae bacterium]